MTEPIEELVRRGKNKFAAVQQAEEHIRLMHEMDQSEKKDTAKELSPIVSWKGKEVTWISAKAKEPNATVDFLAHQIINKTT